jgi:New glue family protein
MRISTALAFCLIVCIVAIGCDNTKTSGTKTQTTTTTPGGQTTTTTERKTETTPSSATTTTTQTIETKGDNRPEPNP